MRVILASVVVTLFACGPSDRGGERTPDADEGGSSCTGLECAVVQCEKMGKPPTTVSGTVYAPNGTLALYGAMVYVPSLDPGPVQDGVTCGKCAETLPGGSIQPFAARSVGIMPMSERKSVLFPIPLRPMMPRISPCGAVKLMSGMTTLCP